MNADGLSSPATCRVTDRLWGGALAGLALLLWPLAGVVRGDLTQLSIEELMNLQVTSVARRSQRLSESAAAVFVITQEDLRRSGATSIPEALRMVPGLQVARIDANKWAVSSRGFNERFANKLLVMIDGRTVYTPIFSGVFWSGQDTLLEDVERIEVIRGPGAALWGANAVNGVINIITRSARDTQGGLVTAGAGSAEGPFGAARFGGRSGEDLHYRAFVKYFDHPESVEPSGRRAADDWWVARGGARLDWEPDSARHLTLTADLYDGESTDRTTRILDQPPFLSTEEIESEVAGHSLLGRWQQRLAGGSEYALQLSYGEEETVRTLDAEFQHRLAEVAGHKALWGLGYRRAVDQLDELGAGFLRLEFDPQRRTSERYGFFLQDELALWPDTLSLLLGTKIEHNSYTGIEIQPNARLLLTPWSDHTLWAAVARAVRTPSRAERDVRFEQSLEPTSGMPLGVARFVGNEDFDSEALIAYEAGYRWQAARNFSTDLALFLNDYRELRTIEAGRPQVETASGAPRLVLPVTPGNGMEGQTWGAELLLDYRPLERWRLQASYTFLEMDLATAPGSIDRSTPEATEGQSPRHQASLRSLLNLPHALELDAWLRLVDELPAAAVERYLTLDLRLGWRPLKGVELSLVGQNLLDRSHPEFEQDLYRTARSEVERSVYGKLSFSF